MPTLVVDPAQYAHAAESMATVAQSTHAAVGSLVGELGGSSGMGGSDNAGVEWANSYDEGARAALQASAAAVGATSNVATRLHATGTNHAQADASSTIGGGHSAIGGAPTPPTMAAPSVPSAAGGSGGGPPGWSLVEGLVGYAWPNGHQDRLHAADAAWKSAAAQLQEAAGPTGAAASAVGAQRSPEASAAARACTDTGTHLRDLSAVYTQIGSSCSEYATHLDEAHHEIISTLKELIIETAAIEAAGAAFAIFTAGLDEVAAQAAVAARIATAAAKIRRVIEALVDAARGIAAAAKARAARAFELLARLKPLEEATIKRAQAAGVEAGPKIAENAGSIRTVNPGGGTNNCVNCVATTDKVLDGEKVSAVLSEPQHPSVLENMFGAKFAPSAGKADIDSAMQLAGDGARGVVYGGRVGGVGHVFNAVNQGGVVRYLDGQIGREASFSGFDHFYFMRYR